MCNKCGVKIQMLNDVVKASKMGGLSIGPPTFPLLVTRLIKILFNALFKNDLVKLFELKMNSLLLEVRLSACVF